jgi:hypothetical protein
MSNQTNNNPILFQEPESHYNQVTCLGKSFNNDNERRDYFTDILRKKLKDPEFRKIEGFPIGSDEDILNLSDPPYFTACPNPWLSDFIAEWELKRPKEINHLPYHRDPFTSDVSEGKNHPIYNALAIIQKSHIVRSCVICCIILSLVILFSMDFAAQVCLVLQLICVEI